MLDSSVDGHRMESISSQMYYLYVLCGFIGVTVDLVAGKLHGNKLFGRIKAGNFLASGATSSFSKGPLLGCCPKFVFNFLFDICN
jgi:hypothetical protein